MEKHLPKINLMRSQYSLRIPGNVMQFAIRGCLI